MKFELEVEASVSEVEQIMKLNLREWMCKLLKCKGGHKPCLKFDWKVGLPTPKAPIKK